MLWQYLLIGLISLLAGFWLGGRRGRKVQREAQNELNTKSLKLLEIQSKVNATKKGIAESHRKDRLLNHTLKQLHKSKVQTDRMRQLMITQNKKQHIDESYLRLKATKSHEKAIKATALARKATEQLKRWEAAVPTIQAMKRLNDKQNHRSKHQSVDVFDNRQTHSSRDIVRRVSNRDSRRLSQLKSSNEASSPTTTQS